MDDGLGDSGMQDGIKTYTTIKSNINKSEEDLLEFHNFIKHKYNFLYLNVKTFHSMNLFLHPRKSLRYTVHVENKYIYLQ